MTLPTFLVIGAPKAGTTSLYAYLDEHPDVFMSPVKEPRFFALGDARFSGSEWSRLPPAQSLSEYRSLFSGAGDARAIGEASTMYLRSSVAAREAARLLPGAKLVVLLRDPVDRAYSAWGHLRRDGLEPIAEFEAAVGAERRRLSQPHHYLMRYVDSGLYGEQLAIWLQHFERSALLIGIAEEFSERPLGFIRDCYEHVGVRRDFAPHSSVQYNRSGRPRSRVLQTVLQGNVPVPVRALARRVIPTGLRRRSSQRLAAWNVRPHPALSNDAYDRLSGCFSEDLELLRSVLGGSLPDWPTVRALGL